MSVKKIDKIKESKLFRGWDILLYLLIVVLILVLLWAFIWRVPKTDLNGVEVLIKNEVVLSYNFQTGKIINTKNVEITNTGEKIIANIYIDDNKKDYNIIEIDIQNKTTKMIDSNCSKSKDCTKMETINGSGQSIICVPHQLIVRSFGDEIIKDPISS